MIGLIARVENGQDIKSWARSLTGSEFKRRTGLKVTSYALRIEKEAKKAAPVRANVLRGSIHTVIEERSNSITAKVGTNVHYGPYLEYGTGKYGPKGQPYEIKPKTKKALAWKGNSVASDIATGKSLFRSKTGRLVKSKSRAGMIVRRKVIHPGIRPRPFLGPPFERLMPHFQADLKQIVDYLGRSS